MDMRLEEFATEIYTLKDHFENRDMEEYLLALYKNIYDNKKIYLQDTPSLDLILCILKESFGSEATGFDNQWLKITSPPDHDRMNRKFTNPDIKSGYHITNLPKAWGIEFTLEVLKFQISELHKMRGKQLEDKYRNFGIDSDTGHRWYNFDPFSNLACGVSCMLDNEEDADNPDWAFIGNLLEDGRIYE